MKKIGWILALSAALIAGCGEHKSEAKKIESSASEQAKSTGSTAAVPPQKSEGSTGKALRAIGGKTSRSTLRLSAFYRVFKDGADIDPRGKPMLLVFGQPQDPYTQKLQQDVAKNAELAAALEKDVTPIYIDATSNKRHKFFHNGEAMDVDTKTLVSIYHIDATPTLIFTDEKGKTIFSIPSYLPPKKFEPVLRFIHEGLWRGKNRENGEVEEALKAYFKAHGIAIGGKK